VLGAVLTIMLFGFITGSLARLAVPGPDPMPVWLTVAFGLAGSIGGGSIAIAIWGRSTQIVGLFAFLGAILLVVAYRRFVQKRPITGPEAHKFPDRGFGIERAQERRRQLEELARQARETQGKGDVDSNLQKLADLHEAGILTDAEFEEKKDQLLSRN
jgi:uncharacterized membrane protein YeaQ/YmgE (transglycosylase-associated protein family)